LASEDLFRHWSELEEADQQFHRAVEVAEWGTKAHPHSIGLLYRAAEAHRAFALQLRRGLDRESSISELNRVLDLVKLGADIKIRGGQSRWLKSRLFECGAKAALQHPSKAPGKDLVTLWQRELPDDPWLVEYASQLTA
jgi:hypothetical protein